MVKDNLQKEEKELQNIYTKVGLTNTLVNAEKEYKENFVEIKEKYNEEQFNQKQENIQNKKFTTSMIY